MAEYEHLSLTRVQRPPKRRRKVRPGFPPERQYDDFGGHAGDLDSAAEQSVAEFHQKREEVTDFDPKFILRFDLHRRVTDEEWRRSGLTVLDSGDAQAVIVFADEENLDLFRERLSAYAEGPGAPQPREDGEGETQPSAPYEGFFDAIKQFRFTEPEDRMSGRLEEAVEEDEHALRPFDVEFWFSGDQATREEWMREAAERAEQLGGELLDEYVNRRAGLALARFRGDGAAIRGLAKLDQVAAMDVVPQPILGRGELAELQDIGPYEDVPEPPGDAPVVGLIDSGLLSGHPLLEPAVAEAVALHPEFGEQGEDEHGHGTLVAGLALYGNVLAAARVGEFEPNFWLASVRILDGDAEVPEAVSWVKAISEAIEYLAESWQVRVINLSVGDSDNPFGGGKSSPLAAELDSLARRFGLVIVVSAGNLDESSIDHERWPDYLQDTGPTILDPAQASTPLTVGAIAASDGLSERSVGSTLDAIAVAESNGPAPYTTQGPGVRNAIKPELVADGGNRRYDRVSESLQRDPAIEVISTSGRYPDRLFEGAIGTSFAAPAVTNVAGRLTTRYPNLSANAIRALMLQAAAHAPETKTLFEGRYNNEAEKRLHALCGFGRLNWERCAFSDDNRVVMIAEDSIRPEDFHIYRIPMTEAFTDVKGPHQVTIGLAFSPPVRHRRFDYLAFEMDFQLVRAIDFDKLFDLAAADPAAPAGERLADYEPGLRPTRMARSKGANQMARWVSSQRPREQFHDDWYLVVKSFDKWMPKESEPQPYALAVSIEAEESVELFAQLEAEVELELQV
jgi:Subtilase family